MFKEPSPALEGSALSSRPVTGILNLDNAPPTRPRGTAPPRRPGGWADETSRAKSAKAPQNEGAAGFSDDDNDDVPIIPDLEEVEQEDLATQVAEAPSVAVNRVATYKELDTDLFKHAAFATLDDIDLRILTRCMAPEHAVKEVDETWSWDILFTDVSSDMLTEWFPETEQQEKTKFQERPYTAFNRFPV
ncbi:intraflagellar transport protein 43 homolog [Eurytemora carolleeae]|uniref:intraflagellar transport protein 43 homolog n=1 Tax=Eurytemora carolleeae TaxID=1294199 RepID=UPI000C7752C1|nr:intraflagellar transport protein 43 homolog [Eurytemora carolleeae]|eukprot:XP_023333271.1 intraflagellar transport protein 43 homolog [Eurytemora affinis]